MNIARRWPSPSQEEGSHQKSNSDKTLILELWENKFLLLNPTVDDILELKKTHNKNKNQLIQTELEMTYMTKLFKRDVKAAIITIFHILMIEKILSMLNKDTGHMKETQTKLL